MDDQLNFENQTLITTNLAAELTGYSSDYIGQLARDGGVASKKIAGRRFVDRDELIAYADENKKSFSIAQLPAEHRPISDEPEPVESSAESSSAPEETIATDEQADNVDQSVPETPAPDSLKTLDDENSGLTVSTDEISQNRASSRWRLTRDKHRSGGGEVAKTSVSRLPAIAMSLMLVASIGIMSFGMIGSGSASDAGQHRTSDDTQSVDQIAASVEAGLLDTSVRSADAKEKSILTSSVDAMSYSVKLAAAAAGTSLNTYVFRPVRNLLSDTIYTGLAGILRFGEVFLPDYFGDYSAEFVLNDDGDIEIDRQRADEQMVAITRIQNRSLSDRVIITALTQLTGVTAQLAERIEDPEATGGVASRDFVRDRIDQLRDIMHGNLDSLMDAVEYDHPNDIELTTADIGTTTSGVLEVTGQTTLSQTLINGPLSVIAPNSTSSNTLFVDTASGRVGINTDTPQYTLDVNGTFRADSFISNSTTTAVNFTASSTDTNTLTADTATITVLTVGDLTATSSADLATTTITDLSASSTDTDSLTADDVVITNSTTTNSYIQQLLADNSTTTNAYVTSLVASSSNLTSAQIEDLIATNSTTTNSYIQNLLNDNTTTTNAYITNLIAEDITVTNATTTNSYIQQLLADNSTTTNAYVTSLVASSSDLTSAQIEDLIATNSTTTNAYIQKLLVDNSTTTNAFITSLVADNLTATSGTITNLVATDSTTTNAYITNLLADNSTSSNLYSSSLIAGSGDITDFTAENATITNATTTNFFATLANFTTAFFDNLTATIADITNLEVDNATTTNLVAVQSTTTDAYIQNLLADQSTTTNLTVTGDTILGNTALDTLTVNATVETDLVPNSNATLNLGSPSFYWNIAYLDTINANNISAASTSISGTQAESFTLNTDNSTQDGEDSELIFYRGQVTPNAVIQWDSVADRFDFNQSLYINNESASTTNPTLVAEGVIGQTADLFQLASSSGDTLFSVGADGSVDLISASATDFTATNATTTNFFASLANFTTAFFDNLTATIASITNLEVDNATTTNLVATDATTTNLTASGQTDLATTSVTGNLDVNSGSLRISDSGRAGFEIENTGASFTNSFITGGIGNPKLFANWTLDDEPSDDTKPTWGTKLAIDQDRFEIIRLPAGIGGDSGTGQLMVVDAAGQVGIGTSTPIVSLDINHTDAVRLPVGTSAQRPSGESGYIRYNSDTAQFEGFYAGAWQGLGGVIDVDQDTYITAEESTDDDHLRFYTAGSEQMTITAAGDVGIGTDNPAERLEVAGSGGTRFLVSDDTGYAAFRLDAASGETSALDFAQAGTNIWGLGMKQQSGNDDFWIWDAPSGDTPRFVIDAVSGDVGIGTTSPANTLDVDGGIDADTLNTGQGDNELYAMDQDVQMTDDVTFASVDTATITTDSFSATSADFVDLTADNATTTNFFASLANFTTAIFDNLTATIATITNLEVDNATTTNLVATDATTTNLTATGQTDLATTTVTGDFTVNTDNLYVDESTGVVGIGINSPSSYSDNVLDLGGGLAFDGQTMFRRLGNDFEIGDMHSGDGNIHNLYFFTNGNSNTDLSIIESGNIGIATRTPAVSLDINATDAVRLPVGTSAERPSGEAGFIRYNSENSQFEGFYAGAWQGLGGVIDVDQDTYITAEESSDEDYLRFYTAGSERMTVTNTGEVGIGTTSPENILSIDTSNTNDDGISLYENGNPLAFIGDSSASFSTGVLRLYYENSERVRINSSGDSYFNGGDIGIGVSSPDELLHVDGDSAESYIKVSTASGDKAGIKFIEGSSDLWTLYHENTSNSFSVNEDGTDYLRIISGGNVGIGTTSPATTLDVAGTTTAQAFSVGGDTINDFTGQGLSVANNILNLDDVETLGTSLTAGSVVFSDGSSLTEDNTNFFWDDANDRLGIGTNSPTSPLHIIDSGFTLAEFTRDSTAGAGFTLSNNTDSINFGLGAGGEFFAGISGGTDNFFAASSTTFQVGSNSRIGFTSGTSPTESNVDTSLFRNAANVLRTNDSFIVDGSIGIGTTSPASELDVWGDFRAGTSSTPTLFSDASTGRVGIGTSSPDHKLTIREDTPNSTFGLHLDGAGSAEPTISFEENGEGENFFLRYSGPDNKFYLGRGVIPGFFSQEAIRMTIERNSGRVGIGTTNPASTLDVAGTTTAQAFSVGGDIINDFTGTGLSVAANVLNVTLSPFSTDDLSEGSNLYFTDQRARDVFSTDATGLTYSAASGVLSLTTGYNIPLTASTTDWQSFYETPSTRITAGTGLSWSANTLNTNDIETLTTSFTAGSIIFSDGTNLAQDNANFFWDDTNNRLGIGTTTPSAILEIVGGGSTPYLRIGSGGGGAYAFEVDENDKVSVGTGNDDIYFNTSGDTQVGVGTSSPISDFTVVGDSYFQGDVEVTGTTSVARFSVATDTITDITGDGLSVVSQGGGGLGLTVDDIETLSTGLSAGSIVFSDGLFLTEDSDNFFWDDASNRLGIGTSSPSETLQVAGTAWLRGSGTTNGLLVNSSGNVGIGTLSPTTTLEVAGTTTAQAFSVGGDTINDFTGQGLSVANNILNLDDVETFSTSLLAGSVVFSDGSTLTEDNANFFWDDANNRLGIGTTSPASKLDVWGDFRAGTSTTPTLFADTAANRVGIGTVSPSHKLTIREDASNATFGMHLEGAGSAEPTISFEEQDEGENFFLRYSGADNNFYLGRGVIPGFASQEAIRMTIERDSDRVGIGTTNPASTLDVAGDITSSGVLDINGTGTSTFEGGIDIAGSILPRSDAAYDLGSASLQWRDVYISSGSLYIGGQKVLEEDADGDINITADPDQNLKLTATGTGSVQLGATGSGSTNVISGNFGIGIGTTSPATTLEVGGTATVNALAVGGDTISDFTGTGLSVASNVLNVSLASFSTTDLAEGTNLYFTNERAEDAAGGMFSGNTETLITATYEDGDGTVDLVVDNNLANYSNATSLFLDGVTATGLEKSGTDVALTTGYNIPLTASTTDWQSFYETPSSRVTAGTGLSWSTNTLNVNDVETLTTSLTAGSIIFSNGTNLAQDNANFFWDSANSRLGIGTNGPSALLEVAATGTTPRFRVESATSGVYALDIDGDDMATLGTGNGHIFLDTSGTTNVGVGTSTPAVDFQVEGIVRQSNALNCDLEANANGDLICAGTSDFNLKTNIFTYNSTSSLAKINQLEAQTYNYTPEAQLGERKEIGFIAQDVEKIFPELVGESNGYKYIRYDKLTVILAEAVQELDDKVIALQAQQASSTASGDVAGDSDGATTSGTEQVNNDDAEETTDEAESSGDDEVPSEEQSDESGEEASSSMLAAVGSWLTERRVEITDGIARFVRGIFNSVRTNRLIVDNTRDDEEDDEDLDPAAGTGFIATGERLAEIENNQAATSSQIIVTFTREINTSYWVEKAEGAFSVHTTDDVVATTTFDYFIIGVEMTEEQVASSSAVLQSIEEDEEDSDDENGGMTPIDDGGDEESGDTGGDNTAQDDSQTDSADDTASTTNETNASSSDPSSDEVGETEDDLDTSTTTASSTPDTTTPTISGTSDVILTEGDSFDLLEGVTAEDDIDGDITNNITVDEGGFDANAVGEYFITYTVADQAGNEATAERTVVVEKVEEEADPDPVESETDSTGSSEETDETEETVSTEPTDDA
ncbi:MAG: immunoglobulin-like domain-containing protein [Candidatus Paceibacterota bacterium]